MAGFAKLRGTVSHGALLTGLAVAAAGMVDSQPARAQAEPRPVMLAQLAVPAEMPAQLPLPTAPGAQIPQAQISQAQALQGQASQSQTTGIQATGAQATGAQTAAPAQTVPAPAGVAPAATTDGATVLGTISVSGEAATDLPNTLEEPTGIDRLPGRVQDTPQIINVIPPELIEQQNVTTLEQALRNVPGVTVTIGEGGGGQNGDQFRIRGFEARGDVYVDGLRDFGVYTRDSFNTESIEVFKGPSSETFGIGTTGGVINSTSKVPRLDTFYGATATGGMGPYGRLTADLNQQVTDNFAVRLNGMAHHSEPVDRDEIESERWGFAPSVGLWIGDDARLTVGYLHQEDDRVPDYGVPVIAPAAGETAEPVTEFDVDRSNFYGNDTDTDETSVNIVTVRGGYDATDWLSLYNDTRLGFYDRTFAATPAGCNAACVTALFDGNPATVPIVTRGGPGPYEQDSWGVQNITSAVAQFETGALRHEIVAGVDVFYQNDERETFAYTPARPTTSLLDPVADSNGAYRIIRSTGATAYRESEGSNVGLFISERLWLTDWLSVVGGVRWDRYHAETETYGPTGPTTRLESRSTQINPKASVIFEPTDFQTYYFSWAKSSNPPGQYITSAPSPLTAATDELDPEKNELFELGAKIGLFEGRLGLSAAAFVVDKGNARDIDPLTGDPVFSGDEQRVRGVELGVAGQITDDWSVNLAYTYLDTEITDSLSTFTVGGVTQSVEGNEVQFVPEHAASLWTTYNLSSLLPTGPGTLTVGGGITYRDKVFLNAGNTSEAPENFSLDAVVAYEMEQFRIALNGYNLTDRLNYDQVFGNRVVPSPGRTVLLTASAEF